MTAAACFVPVRASALVFGELQVRSYLGQPLRVAIPVRAGQGEQIDPSCLSLAKPPARSDSLTYLTQATLALVPVKDRFELRISTPGSINDPYVKLLVKVNCGNGSYEREFTTLLDPASVPEVQAPAVPATPSVAAEHAPAPSGLTLQTRQGESLRSIAAGLYPGESRMQRRMIRALRKANPELRGTGASSPLPDGFTLNVPELAPVAPQPEAESAPAPVRVKAPKAPETQEAVLAVVGPSEKTPDIALAKEGGMLLKLSTGMLDLTPVGKLSEAQRQRLRQQQLQMDSDDEVATLLGMRNRAQQLEKQVGEMRATLDAANRRIAELTTVAAARKEELSLLPATRVPAKTLWWGGAGVVAAGAALFAVSLWFRRRRRLAALLAASKLDDDGFESDDMLRSITLPEPVAVPAGAQVVAEEEGEFEEAFHPTSIFVAPTDTVTFTEAESVLDEADLYLAYGWANRAIDLLSGYLENHPEDAHLWKKLFEAYSGQGMRQEFEQLVVRCNATIEDEELHAFARRLGRQLDPDNPLYRSQPEKKAESPAPAAPFVAPPPPQAEEDTPDLGLDQPLDFILDTEAPTVMMESPETTGSGREVQIDIDMLLPDLVESIKGATGTVDHKKNG